MKKFSLKRKPKEQPVVEIKEEQILCEHSDVEIIVKENKVGELIEKIQIAIKNSKYSDKMEYVSTLISYIKDSLANKYKTKKKLLLTALRVLISASNYIIDRCDDDMKNNEQKPSFNKIFEPIQQEIHLYKQWKNEQNPV